MTIGDLPAEWVELLAQRRALRLRVEGESMAPTLRPGDVLVAEQISGPTPEPGDVVLLRSAGGSPAVHRVVARRRKAGEWVIVTAGDAADRLDAVVHASSAVARVVGIERRGEVTPLHPRSLPWALRLRALLKLRLRRPHTTASSISKETARASSEKRESR